MHGRAMHIRIVIPLLLALAVPAAGSAEECHGQPDGTPCAAGEDATCLGEVCTVDYREETAYIHGPSPTRRKHLGGEWCRGKFVVHGSAPVNCTNDAGGIVDCCDPASRFAALVLTVTDGGATDGDPATPGYAHTTTFTCDQCWTSDGRYLTCTGDSHKATIRDHTDDEPGLFGFKLLPRGLDATLQSGEAYAEPITCTFRFLPEERQIRGRHSSVPLPEGSDCSCESTPAGPTVRPTLVCDRCEDGPSVP